MASVEANKALVRRFIEAVWNEGALAAVDELVMPDFVNHSAPPGTPADRVGLMQTVATTRTTFPDFHVTVEELVAEGDLVVAHFTARGTHQLAWEHPIIGRIASTGRPVQWRGVRLFRLTDGQVAATCVYTDMLALLQQLGALPGLPQAAS